MKPNRLQAQFIRKREIEQQHNVKTNENRKYYDTWTQQTKRYDHWSAPEYYHLAEEKAKQHQMNLVRLETLQQRQTNLKALISAETLKLDKELNERNQPSARNASKKILSVVRDQLFDIAEGQRSQTPESILYSRLRLARNSDQEKILKESKNNHQAMAKLSWLDRQIASSIEKEEKTQINRCLELQLIEEKSKHEAFLQSRSVLRNDEISQMRSIQEVQTNSIDRVSREAHDLKIVENTLKKKLVEIQKEIENLNSINIKRRDRVQALYNYRKVKMILRERSEAVKREIQSDLNLLDRISFDREFDNNEAISYLRLKLQTQHDKEQSMTMQIETMYESEAKDQLKKQIDLWDEDAMVRHQQLMVLMDDRSQSINDKINECVRKQSELRALNENHHKALEQCNQRLKDLINTSVSESSAEQMNRPFIAQRTENVINTTAALPEKPNVLYSHLALPKYGRKKVAWM